MTSTPASSSIGQWWTPERPDLTWTGTLTFGPGVHPTISPVAETGSDAVVWGEVSGLGKVTLCNDPRGSTLVVGAWLRGLEALRIQWTTLQHSAVSPRQGSPVPRSVVLSGRSERRVAASLRSDGSFEIVTRWGAPFEMVWRRFATPIDTFLQVAAGHVGGWTSVASQLHPDGATVTIHTKSLLGPRARTPSTRWVWPLLRLDDLGERSGPVLRAWLGLHQDFEVPICEVLAAWAETAPDQRCRRMAMAVEGLSELASDWLHPPMDLDEWDSLKEALCAGGLQNDVLVKIEQAVFRPSFADQLDAVIAALAALGVPGIRWLESEASHIKKVRNSYSHAERRQHRPGPADAEAAAVAAEAMALGLLMRALPLPVDAKRSLVGRAIVGPS